MGIVYGLDDFLEIFYMRVLKCLWWGEVEFKGGDNLREVDKSRDCCGGFFVCCVLGLGCGSISVCFLGIVLLFYLISLVSSLLSFGFFGWGSDRGLIFGFGLKLIDYIF